MSSLISSNTSKSSSSSPETKRKLLTNQIIKKISKEIPYFASDSPSVRFLQSIYLCKHCFRNEIAFKQMVAHLILTICEHAHNAPLILNLSIPLSIFRSAIMDKFRFVFIQ